ncbi:hypothetical protein ACM61V_04570 [Sphingomonas sp. TX0543]
MTRRSVAITLAALSLAACAHPEDRRWTSVSELPAASLPPGEVPQVRVYSFTPPKPDAPKSTIRDFSDRGQAAIIDSLAAKSADPDAFRKQLATPLKAPSGGGADDRTKLARILVVSISKGPDSRPGDRLVRTIVTITPKRNGPRSTFEFAGYTVAATDTKVQSIAHLEDVTDLSLTASLAPTIKGFGDNSVGGTASNKRTTSADIISQYENLNVDITPDSLVLTRESERGLDVVGNTLVSLTLAPTTGTDPLQDFVVSSQKLFEAGKPLTPEKATFAISPLSTFARADLVATVTLRYVLRRIVSGREFYTEGKQGVQLVTGNAPGVSEGVLVRSVDAQPLLYMVCIKARNHQPVMAVTVDGRARNVLYDDADGARAMATWLSGRSVTAIGGEGVTLGLGRTIPLPAGATYYPMPLSGGCNPLGS